jgi:predicted amidohydrolase YtcJ
MKNVLKFSAVAICLALIGIIFCAIKKEEANLPDLILYNGKIITVNEQFSIKEAVAIKKDRITAIGSSGEIKQLAGSSTKKIDLKGKTVIPGLIEAHVHPEDASISELYEEIPDVHTIGELLDWIKKEAEKKSPGEWIVHPRFFPTRLKEMRQPTKKELDNVAPKNPVFLNGSYGGMINTAAMIKSGITKSTNNPGVLKDPVTKEPTGIIQASAFRLLKGMPSRKLTYEERLDALVNMIKRYNEVGITSFWSGAGGPEELKMYMDLWKSGRLSARVFQNISVPFNVPNTPESEMREKLLSLGYYTGFGNEWVRVGALKTSMDGGILTGTAYMREPWGNKAKEIFGITDPKYKGVLKITKEELIPFVRVANEIGWKVTAHCTGGGGVDIMLSAYEEVNKEKPNKDRRNSIIHGNFYTPESIEKMKVLGVYADMQPAWFYKDADAMQYVLGDEILKTFHPNKSLFDAGVIINNGSDHMDKFDSYTSINPYNPFLAMWTTITRKTERGSVFLPEEAITREQALKTYTINNAYGSFEEDIKGSIEPGKLADLIVISDDILTCPEDKIRNITVKMTMLGGKVVYGGEPF